MPIIAVEPVGGATPAATVPTDVRPASPTVQSASDFDLAELFRRIDRHRRESRQSWATVSKQVGVAVSTIRRFETAIDAEADGVLALVGWLGAIPEEFISTQDVVGEPLMPANGGFVRVDMARVASVAGGTRGSRRTTIQRLVGVARVSGCSIASLTRWTPA
jgi:hypothetical protein